MPRYMDAQICGCRMQCCKDLEMMHRCRYTCGSLPGYIDAQRCGCRMNWCMDREMHRSSYGCM
jgi:hypothetical protein